ENGVAAAAFFAVGDTWAESTPTFAQFTTSLKIVGGDADIDNFLLTTRSNIQDLQAAVIRLRAKAVQQKFEDTFVNGDTSSLAKIDEVIDLVKGGPPSMLLMSKRTRRSLNALARTAGGFLQT